MPSELRDGTNGLAMGGDIAIVGIGCLFPKAQGVGHFWAAIKNGIDGIGDVPATHWNPADYFDSDPKSPDMTYARRGGFLEAVDFNPMEFGIAPRDLEATDTTQLLGLVAAKQALVDAGVTFRDGANAPANAVARDRVSVILGVTGTLELVVPLGARLGHPHWRKALDEAGVPKEIADDVVARIGDSYVGWQENSFPGLLGNVVAGRIANRLDLHGTNCVVDAACASSLSAIHLATLELQAGRSDVVVSGGADTFNDIFMFMCFSKTPALSPTGNSKPFDANGDGTILGEGIGVVVLKRRIDAERDGDRIYAVIKAVGTSSDGKGNAIYAPSADGQKRCLRNAHRLAGVSPETIELIEAHGTGTKVGDGVEAKALTEVFLADAKSRPDRPWCALGSVKSQIGHTKAAAGVAGLIKAAMALHAKVLPPTLKVTKPVDPLDDLASPFYVNVQTRPWLPRAGHPRRAGLSAFGFGGSNFHAILEEHGDAKAAPDWDGTVEILALSGATVGEITSRLDALPRTWNAFATEAAASRSSFAPHAPVRLTMVARKGEPLESAIRTAVSLVESGAPERSLPEGIFFSSLPTAGSLGILFPGQGSQSEGMLRDLVNLFPEALDTFAAANVLAGPGEPRISDIVYPPTSFDALAVARRKAELTRTDRAQTALAATEFAAWRILKNRFRISPDAFAGHSFGELTALAAAGRISPVDFFRLAHLRGKLMAEVATGEPTGMTAVLATTDVVESLIADCPSLVVANRNTPRQTVVSGPIRELEAFEAAAKSRSVSAIRLSVAAAFHSPAMERAVEPFADAVGLTAISPGTIPVFANSTATPYPNDPDAARQLIGRQLAEPVLFDGIVRAMVESGVRTFLEIGPSNKLSRMAREIVESMSQVDAVACFAVDASAGSKPGCLDLAVTLARLAVRGHAVDLAAWERESRCRPVLKSDKPGISVPINGANLKPTVPPRPPRPRIVAPPLEPEPMNGPPRTPGDSPRSALQEALAALTRMQEQTAALHQQFLESQLTAQRSIAALMAGQASVVVPAHIPAPLPPVAQRPIELSPVPTRAATPQPIAMPSSDGIATTLLAVVAEKTGYPVETLDLGMSLDTDLGVDSIKRVEILSAIQDKLPEAPIVRPEQLGTLLTLRDVADYLAGPSSPITERSVPTTVPESELAVAKAALRGPNASNDDILAVLLDVVAEKTGYPVETLDASMSMDNDLGIDSIKRVEILSAIQDRLPNAPVVKPDQLGTIRTLRELSDFLSGTPNPATAKIPLRPSDMVTTTDDAPPSTKHIPSKSDSELHAPVTEPLAGLQAARRASDSVLQAAAAAPTRNGDAAVDGAKPITQFPTIDPIDRSILQTIDLDPNVARPRLAIPAGRDIVLVGDDGPIVRELAKQLAASGLGVVVHGWPAGATAAIPDSVAGLVLVAPTRAMPDPNLNRNAFHWIQRIGGRLRAVATPQTRGLIASITAFDGSFGIASMPANADPAAGGLAGMIKTLRHEWTEVAVKAIDLDPSFATADPAAAVAVIVDELLTQGPVEVGIAANHRCTLELARTIGRSTGIPMPLGPADVVLVTGGARGVTAEAAVALAAASKGTMILTGRTPLPAGPDPDWIATITDEAAMKKAIAEHLGAGATPRAVGDFYAKTMSHREIRTTMARIEAVGGRAAYYAVNVSNGRAVADLLHQIRIKYRDITILVHGAGVLADKRVEQLSAEAFDTVFATKAEGARLLLDLLRGEDLKAIVFFGSTTGRIGRIGQFAYAAANEALNKLAQAEARKRPTARVVSINWGPWEGGMVTPALRKIFESEGVGLVPLADGGQFVVRELSTAGRSIEVVAMGKLRGSQLQTTPSPQQRVGGSVTVPQAPPPTAPPVAELSLAFERTVDITTHPVLKSHVLDGRAVLPMAIHLEWLAHAAMHGNPGLLFLGMDNLRITSGVQIDGGGQVSLRALAGRAVKNDRTYAVPVELRGRRKDGKEIVHSRAEVLLTSQLPRSPLPDSLPPLQPYPHPVDEVYKYFLFHGTDLQGIDRVDGLTETSIVGSAFAAPLPSEWFVQPLRTNWVADPLVLDASFQMLILWSFAQHGAGSLPCFAGRYRQYRRQFPAGSVKLVARITRDNGTFARADIDFLDADGQVVAQIQDYECVIDAALNMSFRRNQLTAGLVRT
jgi:acyl transferase domain-containing protein/NAD(P)-dependent dehydrogenase (short-subunit alcohol dehydrogenase family)/acyl carrier protein